MAARAYWKGQIRLALVSIPVEVYPATRSGASISFRQIHEPSGKPVKYEKVVPGIGPIDPDEIVKGYELSKRDFVLLDEEEIEAVKIESRKTLELVQFVENDEIDVLYFEKPYFVVPADDLAEEAPPRGLQHRAPDLDCDLALHLRRHDAPGLRGERRHRHRA